MSTSLAAQPCVAQLRPARYRRSRSSVQCAAQGSQPGEPGRRALLAAAIGLAALPAAARRAFADSGAAPPPLQEQIEPDSTASPAPAPDVAGQGVPEVRSRVPMTPEELEHAAAAKLLEEEEARRKARRRNKGRIRELQDLRSELAEKELVLLEKEQELLEKEQTLMVLREELEIEKKLRTLLTKEKDKAEEEAALAMGLCTGVSILP